MSEQNANTVKTKVFVVHGRNDALRRSMFDFLRAIGLKPIEWSQAVTMTGKASPFIGEILDVAFQQAQAIIVLLTGDDEAMLKKDFQKDDDSEYEKSPFPQARPNVLFEAGLAMGRNPQRTLIVEIGKLRPFSDIAGRHTVRLDNSIKARQDLAQRLATAGCEIDLTGTDWHSVGKFEIDEIAFQAKAKGSIKDQKSTPKKVTQLANPQPNQRDALPEQVSILPSQLITALHPDAIVVLKAIISGSGSWMGSFKNVVAASKLPSGKVTMFTDILTRNGLIEVAESGIDKYYKATTKGIDLLLQINDIDF